VRLLDDKTPLDDEQTRPNYYGGPDNPYEPVKVIDRLGLGAGFYFGSALKYLFRAGKKSDEELSDLKKALWFLSNGAELDYCLPTQIDDRRDSTTSFTASSMDSFTTPSSHWMDTSKVARRSWGRGEVCREKSIGGRTSTVSSIVSAAVSSVFHVRALASRWGGG
jgi:hypothetical protein